MNKKRGLYESPVPAGARDFGRAGWWRLCEGYSGPTLTGAKNTSCRWVSALPRRLSAHTA